MAIPLSEQDRSIVRGRRRRRFRLVLKPVAIFPLIFGLSYVRLRLGWYTSRLPLEAIGVVAILLWLWFVGSTIRDEW